MKKITFIIIIIILILVINGLLHSIWDIWQKKDIVLQAQNTLSLEKQENQRLKSAFSYSQTQEFIEKEARNKLFMVKEGEQKVFIPKELENGDGDPAIGENIPNWKKWFKLFFN